MRKRIVLFIVFVSLHALAFAQTFSPSFFLDLGSSSCYVKAGRVDKGWEVTLHNFSMDKVKDTTFTLGSIDADTLLKIIYKQTGTKEKLVKIPQNDKTNINNLLPVLFQSMVANRFAGQFVVNNSLSAIAYDPKTHDPEKKETEKTYQIRVEKLQLDIKDGFIEHIKVECKLNEKAIIFKNKYPIAVSSKRSLEFFKIYYLHSFYEDSTYEICLRDLLTYNYEVLASQMDISPSDTTLTYMPEANKEGRINVNKEKQDKIFEYKIYTDILGLDEKNPNGLVQIEGQKKIKLWSKYYNKIGNASWGFLQYIEPSIKLNKIEQDKSYLIVQNDKTFDTAGTMAITPHITPLELYRYQQYNVAVTLNLVKLYNENFNIKANLDVFSGFGRTKLRDSVYVADTTNQKITTSEKAPNDYRANTFQWGLALKLNFFPDARWGFDIGVKYTHFQLLDQTFQQTNIHTRKGEFKADDKWYDRAILSPEFELHKNFVDGSKFFVRYVLNGQANNMWYNFAQFQVGYNAYLKF